MTHKLKSAGQPRRSPGNQSVSDVALINLHINLLAPIQMPPKTDTGHLIFKLCSDHLSIEAIPKKNTRIDLSRLKDQPISGHELLLWTPHFLVLRNAHGHEITLRRDGRMIIRRASSEETARRAADEVMMAIYAEH